MKRSKWFVTILLVGFCVVGLLQAAQAAISPSGDVSPNPNTTPWTTSTTGIVGLTGTGYLTVNGGSDLFSSMAAIGCESTASGTVTVTGSGSTWSNVYLISVGPVGHGTLDIYNGAYVYGGAFGVGIGGETAAAGNVTVSGIGSELECGKVQIGNHGTLNINTGGLVSTVDRVTVGDDNGSSGTVNFGPGGGTIQTELLEIGPGGTVDFGTGGGIVNTSMFWAKPSRISGTGIINTCSLMSDFSATFDSTTGKTTTCTLCDPTAANVTVNLDMSDSNITSGLDLGIGYQGDASLTIKDGVAISTARGYVGYGVGSTATATVQGNGSQWSNGASLSVGLEGDGTLTVSGEGTLVSHGSSIGDEAGSTGEVVVTGANSTWTSNVSNLYVGREGHGTLNVFNGGTVIATGSDNYNQANCFLGSSLGSVGIVNVDGENSTFVADYRFHVGAGGEGILNITNGGTVNSGNNTTYIVTSPGLGIGEDSVGVATVSGTGSKWNHANDLDIGGLGSGTLNILDGGKVTIGGTARVADNAGATGLIDFDSGGGTLTSKSIWVSTVDLKGSGTINTHGLVSDVDVVFDSARGASQTFLISGLPNQNVTVHLDVSDSNEVGDLGVGYHGSSSLSIRDGVAIYSNMGEIGYSSGSTCGATVTGTNSSWNIQDDLHVGYEGNGTLVINAGGSVDVSRQACLAYAQGTSAAVTVDGNGSAFNSDTLVVGNEGDATMCIIRGADVITRVCTVADEGGSEGAVIVDGDGSTWTASYRLRVGYNGRGSLDVTNGASVSCGICEISRYSSSSTVNVVGDGSELVAESIYLSRYAGYGFLNIANRATVEAVNSYIAGADYDPTGVVNVDGQGTKMLNSGILKLGTEGRGNGKVFIASGGTITAGSMTLDNEDCLVSIAVAGGSNLTVGSGTGTLTNDGTVRIIAGAGPAIGATYTPISAGTWTGGGIYQALGGTWDETGHEFTVSDVVGGDSGTELSIDLFEKQRILVEDITSGWSLGVSLLAMESATSVDLTATVIGETLVNDLEALVPGEVVQGGWNLSTEDYGSEDPAYLSFGIGSGYSRDALTVWCHDGTGWAEYDAMDLTCGDGYASFTVAGLDGVYAVTTAVPEPATTALLLGLAAMMLLIRKRHWSLK